MIYNIYYIYIHTQVYTLEFEDESEQNAGLIA